MEETFAQIEGAAQHSLADVHVNITAGGSIVGHGVTASANAINVCGGKLDAILRSFGGIEGGDQSIGGKSVSLLEKVGALGVKAGGLASDKLDKLRECAAKMQRVAKAARDAGLNDVADYYESSAKDLSEQISTNSHKLDDYLTKFSSQQDGFISAASSLKQDDSNPSSAGILSLAFTGMNNAKQLTVHVKDLVASLDGKGNKLYIKH